jgi:hypothetical protein
VKQAALRWAKQGVARAALGRALGVLDAARVDVLPVKGVVTTPLLWADSAERDIADVDLRVRPRDRVRAQRAFEAAGFTVGHGSKQWGTFEAIVDGTLVEVETSVGPPGLCGLTVDTMIAHAMRGEAGHLEPELHEHALLLCVNVFKDKLARARGHALEDVARIVRLEAFDDAVFVRVVRAAQSTTLAWLVADFLAQEGDTRWAEIRAALGPPRRAYAATYRALMRRRLRGRFLLPLVARAASDNALERARAVALGAAGTARWLLAGRRAP